MNAGAWVFQMFELLHPLFEQGATHEADGASGRNLNMFAGAQISTRSRRFFPTAKGSELGELDRFTSLQGRLHSVEKTLHDFASLPVCKPKVVDQMRCEFTLGGGGFSQVFYPKRH